MGRKKTTTEYIEVAKKIHGNKYDYSLIPLGESVSAKDKVDIICETHGLFSQNFNNHNSGGKGCSKCGHKVVGDKNSIKYRMTNDEFIRKSMKSHGKKYDYSKIDYKGATTPIIIICKEHGEWEVKHPLSHLRGCGCPVCFGNKKKTTIEYIEGAKNVHGEKYDYSKTRYHGALKKIVIICEKHGEFEQLANAHLQGQNCPVCTHNSSKAEYLCHKLLKDKLPHFDVKMKNRDIPELKGKGIGGGNLEVDIVIKNKETGKILLYVEWNGVYWHSFERATTHDNIKKRALGDKLIVIEDNGPFNEAFVEKQVNTIIDILNT